MHTITVDAPDVSRAWLEACTRLSEIPGNKAFHTLVRIARPLQEDPHLRTELDRLRAARTKPVLYPIDTVVNTLFPAALAATCTTHEQLSERYRAVYPRLQQGIRRNVHGTYFGRLVSYPGTPDKPEPVDQLARVITRLNKLRTSAKWSAVYEAGTAHVLDSDDGVLPQEPAAGDAGPEAVIRAASLDTQTLDFPCLSHCSFQFDSATNTVHLAAYYRSHYLFDRAYGNYLALGHLCAWVARHAGLAPGTVSVMSGCARLDCSKVELGTLQSAVTTPLFGLGA
ncbi:hypothetical protein [Streptomyces aureus]